METSIGSGAVRALRRAKDDRVIAGVAAGVARYLGVDPVLVRIGFVVLALAPPGVGLLLYLVSWILIPSEGAGSGTRASAGAPTAAVAAVVGGLLVALGALLAIELAEPSWIDGRYVAPALLVLLGLGVLVRGARD